MRTVVGPLAQSLVQTSLSHWTRQRFMEKFLNFIIRQKSGNIMMNVFIDSKIKLTPIDSNFVQVSEMREGQPWIKD